MADGGSGQQSPRDLRTVVEDASIGHGARWKPSPSSRRVARALRVLVLFAFGVVVLFLLLNGYINPTKPGERKDLILALAQILDGSPLLGPLLHLAHPADQPARADHRNASLAQSTNSELRQARMETNLEVRLGGIYALEQIARDHKEGYYGQTTTDRL